MDGITSSLLQQGLAGVGLLVMGFVVIRQYNDNKALQAKYDKLQEDRLFDARNLMDKITGPLASISQTTNLLYDKIQIGKQEK